MRTARRIFCLFACALLILSGCMLNGCAGAEHRQDSGMTPEEEAEYYEMARALGERLSGLDGFVFVEPEPTGDVLCDLINQKRAASGAGALKISEALMHAAGARVAELQANRSAPLHQRQNGAEWSAVLSEYGVNAAVCGETVLTGGADEHTVFHAMVLNLNQTSYLTYTGYTQFGYAHNDACDIWVLLLTE